MFWLWHNGIMSGKGDSIGQIYDLGENLQFIVLLTRERPGLTQGICIILKEGNRDHTTNQKYIVDDHWRRTVHFGWPLLIALCQCSSIQHES